eukprot:SAG31_NODE_5226_length_2662_cov_1.657956_2_plen_66_part_00
MLKEGHGLSSELLLANYALTCVVLDEMINKGVVEHLQVIYDFIVRGCGTKFSITANPIPVGLCID